MNSGDKKAVIIIFIILGVLILIPILIFLFVTGIIVILGITIFNFYTGLGREVVVLDKPITYFEDQLVTTYDDYVDIFGKKGNLTKNDFKKNNYYIFEVERDKCAEKNFFLNGFTINETDHGRTLEDLDITLSYFPSCEMCGTEYMYYAVRLDKKIEEVEDATINYDPLYETTCDYDVYEKKPMIYIYPEDDMDVEIKLGNDEYLTTSYPRYEDSWKVFARKDGTLEYDGREYYGLYWEGSSHKGLSLDESGFVIKGEDTAKFLEEKLEFLGLNEREINEFIVYWLPQMEHNEYNFIRFETEEEIEEYMPLEITPEPDTVIRVYMQFEALDEEIEVEEQELTPVSREGFTVVEWGGSSNEE